MSTISNKESALLGLLCEKPMHPYEIESCIKDRSMREWTEISMSSVYKLLRSLEERKLVKSRVQMSKNNVAQKVYSLTPDGKKAIKEKVKELMSNPEHMVYRIDLATSNLRLLSKKDALACFDAYEKNLEAGVKCYAELEKYLRDCGCPSHRMALARRPIYLLKAEIEWIRSYRKELESGVLT
jgi:DNA-binding PadR family transcriptional regulator